MWENIHFRVSADWPQPTHAADNKYEGNKLGVNMDLDRTDYILFDLGGKVPSLWTNYYENLDGLVLVIDSTNKE